MDVTRAQLLDDRQYLLNLVANNYQVVDPAVPERRAEVVELLERSTVIGRRLGGPTRDDLWDLAELCPGEPEVRASANKADLIADLLRRVRPAQPNERVEQEPPDGPPAAPPPARLGSCGARRRSGGGEARA